MDILSIINSVDWHTLNWDLFVIIIFIVGVLTYSFFLGRDRVFVILISGYISLALLSKSALIFETFNIQIQLDNFVNTTALFLGYTIVLFFIFSYSAFTSVFDKSPAGTLLQTTTVSFLQIGFFISAIISFLSPEEINTISIFIKSVFVENQMQSFWLLAPLLSILLFRGRRRIY